MSQITLEFDNSLKKSEIIIPLSSSSKSEAGDNYTDTNLTDKAQTEVFGIQVPIVVINSTVISFDAIKYFDLKSEGRLPELTLIVEDRYQLINNIDKPGNDNEVRVQILPRFDNTYKKIDLTFFITSIRVTGSLIKLTASYKLSELSSSKFKSFGQLSTYSLFKNSAKETGLGFATNIGDCNDLRYMYCDNKSLLQLMNDEIQFSNATEHILDYWIDLWDNINLVDIKERYESIDSDDDLMIWTCRQIYENTVDTELIPLKLPAVIHNNPINNASELFVKEYSIDNKSGAYLAGGTDKVIGVYEDTKNEYLDYFIQDGDIKNDIFFKYEYLGENYGEYNYLLAKLLRESYIQKINTEKIKVTLQAPAISLMRGHKVNYIRYINDDAVENKIKALENADVIDRNIESNIPLSDYEIEEDGSNGKFRIDKTVSGQYLIYGVDIVFQNNSWDYILTLVKPASSKKSIIKDNNE